MKQDGKREEILGMIHRLMDSAGEEELEWFLIFIDT